MGLRNLWRTLRTGPVWRDRPIFAPKGLDRLAAEDGYRTAAPFPHFARDGLFDVSLLRAIIREFPDPGKDVVEAHNDGVHVRLKHNTTWETHFGPNTRRFFAEMASPPVLLALERVSGIPGLIADPYLFGGGLHSTATGGSLAIHADFARQPKLGLVRRLNLLIYLNENWTEANGGWLELWDRDMTECVARALPVFNRTVLFNTSDFSFHGQPDPATGPGGSPRRSMAFYYYTSVAHALDTGHSTVWRERPSAIPARGLHSAVADS